MLKLHLGCGKKNFGPEWIHIDGENFNHLDSHDITKLSFDDNTVDLIYASHVFQYFDRKEAIIILNEWRRVLKFGGILRLAVPDFKKIIKLYANDYSLNKFLGPLYGKMKMRDKVVYHKTVYDYSSLDFLLKLNGFTNIKPWNWKEVDHGVFDDYSQAYIPHMDKENGTLISLNLECIKS
jgi:predicted SAM-dependent methyltransferase